MILCARASSATLRHDIYKERHITLRYALRFSAIAATLDERCCYVGAACAQSAADVGAMR